MKKSIFAVCDLEASYACSLMDYLNEKKSTPFEVQAFTNVESLVAYARKHPLEILLISSRAMCNEIRELPVNRIIILSEGEKLGELEEYPFVYKYQSSDALVSEVMEYYSAGRTAGPGLSADIQADDDSGGLFAGRQDREDLLCPGAGRDPGGDKADAVP